MNLSSDSFNEILKYITDIRDSWTLLFVCRAWNKLLTKNDSFWKHICLHYWKDFTKNLSLECIDLETVKKESDKDWIWFFRDFCARRVFQYDYFSIAIGQSETKKLSGYAILSSSTWIYIGNFSKGSLTGKGTTINLDNSTKYQGKWNKGQLHGQGSLSYADGYKCTGKWFRGQPQFDPRHPIVKECVDAKTCTNALENPYPKRMFYWYCETCFTAGHHEQSTFSNIRFPPSEKITWNPESRICTCDVCNQK
jgi:hypothetical protein